MNPEFQAALDQFHAAGPKALPEEALVVIDSIGIGIPIEGQKGDYSEILHIEKGIGSPVVTIDEEGRLVHKFPLDSEHLEGQACIVVNKIKGTLSCSADEIVVKPEWASKGFVVCGYDVGAVGRGGDHDGDSLIGRKKKQPKRAHMSKAMMTLLGRGEQHVYSVGRSK